MTDFDDEDNGADFYDDDFTPVKKKRDNKRRWREIERHKEKRRLFKEASQNEMAYFDFLEEC